MLRLQAPWIAGLLQDAGMYNSREVLLGLPATDYSAVKKLQEQFDPFFQFWTTAHAFRVSAPFACALSLTVACVTVREEQRPDRQSHTRQPCTAG